jgi:NAD(P)-dependent dehydrogenase (short-subunit alcohol dehydrogenase family)
VLVLFASVGERPLQGIPSPRLEGLGQPSTRRQTYQTHRVLGHSPRAGTALTAYWTASRYPPSRWAVGGPDHGSPAGSAAWLELQCGCMDLGLQGRVALVVGGTGLIGQAIVERLRTEGATAVIAARHATDGIILDARDSASVTTAIAQLMERHNRLDALVVAAAPSAQTLDASRHADPAQVLNAVDAKAMTFLRLANAALPIMTKAGYGRIVGVSGQNAYLTGNLTGSVRNAAMIIAAKNLADSVAGSGVTVNTVNPGTVSPDPITAVEPGRGGESSPVEIADLIAFLVSPRARAISGEAIAIGHRVRGVTVL